MKKNVQFRLRVKRGDIIAVGPGKVALLEAIGECGSISAAARALGMSYRRAWMLVDELNRAMREPAVGASVGGTRGGGAVLTTQGEKMIALYRAIEQQAQSAAARDIAKLNRLLKD